MPSLHNFWKLKASVRSTAGCQGGRLKPLFDKGTATARSTKPFAAGSPTPSGSAPSRPFVSSFFSKFFSTNRTSPADHPPTVVNQGHHLQEKALSTTEALSRVFATPSIHGPLLQSCGYIPLEGGGEATGNSLRELSEKGLFLLTGQLPGESRVQKEKKNITKQVITSVSSEQQDVWKERRIWDRNSITDLDSGAEIGGLRYEGKKVTRTEQKVKVTSSLDELFDGKENAERVERGEAVEKSGKANHVDRRLLESFAIQGALGLQHVFNRSIAFHFLHLGTSLPSVGDVYVRALHDASLASADSPGLVLDPNQKVDSSEECDRSSDQYVLKPLVRMCKQLKD